jgi:cell division protein FtsQ
MTTLGQRLTPPAARPERRRTVLLVVALTVSVAIVLTWAVAFSPLFGVRTVSVRGVHTLTPDQVRAAARVGHGTPLVRLDTGAVARRVERLPDVAVAQVDTSFPSTVVITVTERVPVGYVRRPQGVVLVDRTGAQYHKLAHAPAGLPRFVLPGGSTARATGRAVASVAAALPAAIRRVVASINALNPHAISLALTHGRVVQWGSAARTADKARLLPALLARHPQQIDLTDPDQPFTRGSS